MASYWQSTMEGGAVPHVSDAGALAAPLEVSADAGVQLALGVGSGGAPQLALDDEPVAVVASARFCEYHAGCADREVHAPSCIACTGLRA